MSKDLIKRSDVLSVLEGVFQKYNVNFGGDSLGFGAAVQKSIESIPVENILEKTKVKPVKIERQKGFRTDGCPVCKREFYEKFKFCPECGTEMDWGDSE